MQRHPADRSFGIPAQDPDAHVEIRGEFDRFFQPLDGALRVVVLNFPHSLFIFPEGLFRDIGFQLADIDNMIPAQSIWATAVHRASVQKNEYGFS